MSNIHAHWVFFLINSETLINESENEDTHAISDDVLQRNFNMNIQDELKQKWVGSCCVFIWWLWSHSSRILSILNMVLFTQSSAMKLSLAFSGLQQWGYNGTETTFLALDFDLIQLENIKHKSNINRSFEAIVEHILQCCACFCVS